MLAMAILGIAASRAVACIVCIPYPETTAVDNLVGSEVVVLARENPEKPFSYRAIEVLKGELENPDIDLFLDSLTRRRLMHDPDRAVVLTRTATASTTAAPGLRSFAAPTQKNDQWKSLGFASERYEALVREIVDRAPSWKTANTADDRGAFFMPRLEDPEPRIRELAYLEVGQMPYARIKTSDGYVSSEGVRAFVFSQDPRYYEWKSLYVMLLGVNASAQEKTAIRANMTSLARFGISKNISAWATAFIEIDEAEAVDWLTAQYFRRKNRDVDELVEIVKAMSVHGGNGHVHLRDRYARSYSILLDTYPSMAGWIAKDLADWEDWRLAARLSDMTASGQPLDDAASFAVALYVSLAESANRRAR